jgi:hypothetical protein
VKDELAKRVSYLCSNPRCHQPTSGPQASPSGTVNLGVAAHITAAAPGGPRYHPGLSAHQRASSENGIWLCQTCAKLIDSDQSRYSVAKLAEWKSDAEAAAALALEQRRAPATGSEGVFLEAERLMPGLIREMRNDVRDDATQLVRELALLPHPNTGFNHRKPRFQYLESEHPRLQLEFDWLEDMGLIVDVTPGNTPIYRMTEEFAGWLRGAQAQPPSAGLSS